MSTEFFKQTGGFIKVSLIAGLFVAVAVVGVLAIGSVKADGNDSPVECENTTVKIEGGVKDLAEHTTSEGIVEAVCIKSGNNTFDDKKHSEKITVDGSYGNDDCYTVSGLGTQKVSVSRTASPSCKDISHVDVIVGYEVSITQPVLSRCVESNELLDVPFSGTVAKGSNHAFALKLDGNALTPTINGTNWMTGLVQVAAGTHTITAEILDNGDPVESAQQNFTILTCSSDDDDNGDDPDDGGDGPNIGDSNDPDNPAGPTPTPLVAGITDSATPTPTPEPQVAGATTEQFVAPATGMSTLPSLVLALTSAAATAVYNKRKL